MLKFDNKVSNTYFFIIYFLQCKICNYMLNFTSVCELRLIKIKKNSCVHFNCIFIKKNIDQC